jgi:hypothetical protein
VTLLGMLLGMALLRCAAGASFLLWAAFWALTALHVWANVRAMRCLRVTSLNQARLGRLLRGYLCSVSACVCVAWLGMQAVWFERRRQGRKGGAARACVDCCCVRLGWCCYCGAPEKSHAFLIFSTQS